jgi:hypothetical protein
MCFFLYIASPLTLSEVRSMLPPGLTADLLPPSEQAALRPLHRDAQTIARVLRGGCSCDLVTERNGGEDESRLRARYRTLGYNRDQVIRGLELHRRGIEQRVRPAGHWPRELVGFVAEHARNAGPTLYLLQFGHDGARAVEGEEARPMFTADVRAFPGVWLPEDTPTLVVRDDAG